MRRNLLVQLTIAILIPYIGGFLLAWVGFYQFERTMQNVASSYARNLASSVAARLETDQWGVYGVGTRSPKQSPSRVLGVDESLLYGISTPGFFGVFDRNGDVLIGSDGINLLTESYKLKPFVGSAQKVRDPEGRIYTVAVYPILSRNISVMAAIAWSDLLGPMISFSTLWPFVSGMLGLIGIFTVYIMWLKVILPLKDLEDEISTLKWGEDVPRNVASEAVIELQSLREAIVTLARSATEKTSLARRYVNDLVRVQEEERETISREIHDGPLQDITAFVQRLRLIADSNDSIDERLQLIHEAEKIAMTGVRDLRQICNGLTPPWLDLGVANALTELSESLSEQLKVKISLDLEEIPSLSEDETLAFFRVAQEAVNNSVQHGHAEKIEITLKQEEGVVRLTIKDDGSGFVVPDNIAELRVCGHRGLSNMVERMSLAGGTITMNSEQGKGTIILCELPMNQQLRHGSLQVDHS